MKFTTVAKVVYIKLFWTTLRKGIFKIRHRNRKHQFNNSSNQGIKNHNFEQNLVYNVTCVTILEI